MLLFLEIVSGVTFVYADGEFVERYSAYQGYVQSGLASLEKKDYASAITNYSRAIEMSLFEASHYFNRGIAFYRLGKEKEAREDFNKVIILDPKGSSAYVYRGLCRMKGGEYKDALNDYNRALKLNPKDASVHNNLAWLYAIAKDEKFQDKGKALEHARKAAELSNERNAEILDTLARAYFIKWTDKRGG
jgi:Flp pilus assembly protein TadD